MANDNSSRAGGSKRIRFNFWLDVTKTIEFEISELIASLKEQRSFTQTIRDGIRLVCDLKNGKLDVLFELFPWVRAEFMEYISELQIIESQKPSQSSHTQYEKPPQQPKSNSDNASLEAERQHIEQERRWLEAEQERLEAERKWQQRRLDEERKQLEAERQQNQNTMQKKLDRLEELLLQQGNVPVASASTSRKASGVGLKSMNTGNVGLKGQGVGLKGGNLGSTISVSPPIFDDDDDIPELNITKANTSGVNANLNLIKSMQALQQ